MNNIACNLCSSISFKHYLRVKERIFRREYFDILECEKCGLLLTSPVPSKNEIGAYYPNTYAAYQPTKPPPLLSTKNSALSNFKNWLKKSVLNSYYGYYNKTDAGILNNSFFKFLAGPLKQMFYSFPYFVEHGKVLDIGCGNGSYLFGLKELGWDTCGVEMDKNTANAARELLGLNIYNGNFEEIDLTPGSFDVITMWHSLEHFYDPTATLKKAYSLLKPEGIIILGLPNAISFEARIFGKYWWAWEAPRHLYHFSGSTITKLLANCGFSQIKVKYPPNTNNIIFSFQLIMLRYFPTHTNLVKNIFDTDKQLLKILLMPFVLTLSFTNQIGRMVIYGRK